MNFDLKAKATPVAPPPPPAPASAAPSWWDRFVPAALRVDPELQRRARLHVRFSILGAAFGALYAAFYFLVDHGLGGAIVLLCSAAIITVIPLLNRTRSLTLTGHFFATILLAGFTALSLVEGGMRGHAVAWLTCIPLCVLLLLELRSAIVWTVLATLTTIALGVVHLAGYEIPKTYPPEWEPAIDLAGYAGLVPFMALLGLIFEFTRLRAFGQLQGALAELSAANADLVRLNEEKNEFLHIAAHDLKNPLGVISGYAGLLQMFDDHEPEDIKEHAGEILASANRMLDIIHKLLDTRAIEDGRVKLVAQAVPLAPVIDALLRDYAHAARQKGIPLGLEGDPAAITLSADPGALHQILDNLLSNAIKYSPHGRPVRLDLSTGRDGLARIAVVDRGPGLSEEDQSKLFGKFARLTPQPTGGESSNGLGLWIVQRMARLMGGDITCESRLGEGSRFILALPVSATGSRTRTEGEVALPS